MDYNSKAKTTSISASSKVSVCINNTYYTVNYSEERSLDTDDTTIDVVEERKALWDTVNSEVDKQIEDIYKMFKK